MVASPMVVFLDMDGPMQSMRSTVAGLQFDPVAAKLVNELIRQPQVRVVISSTVRIVCKDVEQARERLAKYGLSKMTFHTHWRTGHSLGVANMGRQRELIEWLDQHQEPDVTYVAIEDDPLDIPSVIHVKADFNGLGTAALMQLRYLAGTCSYDAWAKQLEWEQNRQVNNEQQ